MGCEALALSHKGDAMRSLVRSVGLRLAVRVCRALRIRFLVNPCSGLAFTRVGHLAAEPDCFVKEGLVGRRPWYRGVLLFPRATAANPCLLEYWRQRLWVISSPFWVRLLAPLTEVPALRYHTDPYVTAINETATFGAIQTAYAGQPPSLRLTRQHTEAGEEILQRLGVPKGAWFVGVHCREGGYDSNQPCHRVRNVSIESYYPAMRAVVERGGWCIRLGDPSMTPLPPMPGVIDYAHSPLRSDWMDVFLCARARFMLGSASGLSVLASVFGVPCALANQSLPAIALPYGTADLFIPKLIRSIQSGEYLTLAEIMDGPLGNARFTHCLELARTEVEDNSPEDIRDLALEMLAEIEGTFPETEEDRQLQAAAHACLRPGHYTFGATSRFGRLFLRKHRQLLESNGCVSKQEYLAACCGTPQCPCLQNPKWAARQLCSDTHPVAIQEFPKDVVNPAFESSGIYEDGWVSPAASCILTQPGASTLVVRGTLPQVGPVPIASEVQISVDGEEVLRKVLYPGSVDLTCNVAPVSATRRVEFRFSYAQKLPAPDTRAIGMHLTYLGFAPSGATRE